MWWATTGLAWGGQVWEVRRTGPDDCEFVKAGATGRTESIVTWDGRPLELLIVADLSVSVVLDPEGPADDIHRAIRTAYDELVEHPVRGDQLGVTVFASNAQRWVPLGPLDRPGLSDWLDGFGRSEFAPLPFPTADRLKPGQWTEAPVDPTDLGIDAFGTDPGSGLRVALDDLRDGRKPLKAIVVLWDGDQTTEYPVKRLLDRAWAREIHVFTIAVGEIDLEGLTARGGGDVYLATGAADLAMKRILGELRMPEDVGGLVDRSALPRGRPADPSGRPPPGPPPRPAPPRDGRDPVPSDARSGGHRAGR